MVYKTIINHRKTIGIIQIYHTWSSMKGKRLPRATECPIACNLTTTLPDLQAAGVAKFLARKAK